jgi:hypothetical protein
VRVQASAMVANDFSTQANAEGRGATQTDARGRTSQTHADVDAEIDADDVAETWMHAPRGLP